MYDIPYYKEPNVQAINDFMSEHPFIFMTGCDVENKPLATQVPVLVEERNGQKILTGHMMRNTDHHKAFMNNEHVLAVFTGNHSYVSATWYSDPHIGSTWNYTSVHAVGIIRFLDEAGLEEVLRKTTLHFENQNRQSPVVFDNLPDEYKQKMMKAIVAFEIEVTAIKNVFKLSQDRDAKSYQSIIENLNKAGEKGQAVAAEMENRKQQPLSE